MTKNEQRDQVRERQKLQADLDAIRKRLEAAQDRIKNIENLYRVSQTRLKNELQETRDLLSQKTIECEKRGSEIKRLESLNDRNQAVIKDSTATCNMLEKGAERFKTEHQEWDKALQEKADLLIQKTTECEDLQKRILELESSLSVKDDALKNSTTQILTLQSELETNTAKHQVDQRKWTQEKDDSSPRKRPNIKTCRSVCAKWKRNWRGKEK